MSILVTGGSGQLAAALGSVQTGPAGHDVIVIGRPVFDFDRPESIAAAIARVRPALVINAAAWTAVDAAEAEPEAAARANHAGPALLARACHETGTKLIHISTDYVFDGAKGAPYREDDPVNPTGIYGATKLAGEQAVLAALPDAVILRTAWVYATKGKNFVLTMLNAARRVPRLRVVADQVGCPTNAADLAAACLGVAERVLQGTVGTGGIYHACGTGATSWHGFAEAILNDAAAHGWPRPPVDAIATADWPTPARRPADSRLDCARLELVFGQRLPPWRDSLRGAVAAICAEATAHAAPG